MCELKETDGEYFCSVRIHNSEHGGDDLDMFDDTDQYEIALCHSAAQPCVVLINKYQVDDNGEQPRRRHSLRSSPNVMTS